MKKRNLKTKYPVFLSLIFQTMRQIWCIYGTRTEQESVLRKLLLNKKQTTTKTKKQSKKQQQQQQQKKKKAQNNLKIYSTYLQN